MPRLADRQFLDQILRHMPVGVVVVGPPHRLPILIANERFRAYLDEPHRSEIADISGLSLAECAPGLFEDGMRRIFETGEPANLVDVAYRGFGRGATYWNARLVPHFDGSQQVQAVIGFIEETTEQVRINRHLEELASTAAQQATALSAIIESMAEGVYVANRGGQVVMANESGAALLGLSIDEALLPLEHLAGAVAIRSADGRDMPFEEFPLVRALRGEICTNVDVIVRRADSGEDRNLRVTASPISDDDGGIIGAVAIAGDVTRLHQLERQREEFLAIAAHELKTPVTSVKLFAQGMLRTLQRRGGLEPGRGVRDLQTIVRQIDRLNELVNDLLDVGKLRSGRLEYHFDRIDLVALVGAVVERFQTQIEPDGRHTIRLVPTDATLPIVADSTRLDQVLSNLLDNALKYSPSGGEITVRVARDNDPGWARLTVTDQGIGIASDEERFLFDPFTRARQSITTHNISGIGLGLYISREIISRHGGTIRAESDGPGTGATFIVALPTLAQPPGVDSL